MHLLEDHPLQPQFLPNSAMAFNPTAPENSSRTLSSTWLCLLDVEYLLANNGGVSLPSNAATTSPKLCDGFQSNGPTIYPKPTKVFNTGVLARRHPEAMLSNRSRSWQFMVAIDSVAQETYHGLDTDLIQMTGGILEDEHGDELSCDACLGSDLADNRILFETCVRTARVGTGACGNCLYKQHGARCFAAIQCSNNIFQTLRWLSTQWPNRCLASLFSSQGVQV